jgi:very-short-patch-repair endonuclease
MRHKRAKWPVDRAIAAIAGRQHGIITIEQLLGLGLTRDAVKRRVAAGRLHRIHRGVYAVGHTALTQKGVWLAAVKACGQGAALSHQSAAQLQRTLPLTAYGGPIHVSVPGTSGRRRRTGIALHRSTTLTRRDVMVRDAIPLTNPARTLADLREVLTHEEWEDTVDRARVLSLPIGAVRPSDPTRSAFERKMLAICRRHRLPKPEVNARVGPFLVDFVWRAERLIVEADGFEHHRQRAAFEADRARDARLKLMGHTVVRFTWRQMVADPVGVAATIRALLRPPGAAPAPYASFFG